MKIYFITNVIVGEIGEKDDGPLPDHLGLPMAQLLSPRESIRDHGGTENNDNALSQDEDTDTRHK